MDDSENVIAFFDRSDDDAKCGDVVDLIEIKFLVSHLPVDAVDLFDAAADLPLDVILVKFLHQGPLDFVDVARPLLLSPGDLFLDFFVEIGAKVSKSQIFQLQPDPVDSEPVGQRCVDVKGFLGDLHLFLRGVILQGPHVVEPVGQFDQDNPDILDHGKNHLSEIFGLIFFRRSNGDAADLCQTIDQLGDFVTEVFPYLFKGGQCILHGIMKEAGGHAGDIQLELSQDSGHFHGMDQIGFSRRDGPGQGGPWQRRRRPFSGGQRPRSGYKKPRVPKCR